MSYKPKKGSLRDRICTWIAAQPKNFEGVTMEEVTKHFGAYRYGTVRDSVFQLKYLKALVEDDGVYQLSNKLKPHYGIYVAPVIAQEPEAPVRTFKDWTGKYSFVNALRREPIREDVSFLNGSSGFQTLGYRA